MDQATVAVALDVSTYTRPAINEGEFYAGIILGKDGAPDHHLILLPGEVEAANWDDAVKWALDAGGELPNRREQSLLYANLKDQFQRDWYWSSEQHASDSDWAWCQTFGSGYQGSTSKDDELRARAVRRLIIE